MSETIHHAAAIVAAYAATNQIAVADLPGLVGSVRRTLDSLMSGRDAGRSIGSRRCPPSNRQHRCSRITSSVWGAVSTSSCCGRHIRIAHRMSPQLSIVDTGDYRAPICSDLQSSGAWDRNHRRVVRTLIATDDSSPARDHCN